MYVSLKWDFPFEYLHLLCLGVTKRLVTSYLTNNFGLLRCRLTKSMQSELNERVSFYANSLPNEFVRKIRPFSCIQYFKASEYRTLLLYTGPILFCKILPDRYYKHFLLLHFATYILINENLSHLYENASACLQKFLFLLKELFTSSAYTYNAHCLTHIVDFVKMYGSLDKFSSFPYENFLFLLKKRIKSGSHISAQSVNALQTLRQLYCDQRVRNLYFSSKFPNNCAVVVRSGESRYVFIEQYDEESNCILRGRLLRFFTDFYDEPYPSSVIGIGIFTLSESMIYDCNPVSKCVVFPQDNKYIIFPYASSVSEQ